MELHYQNVRQHLRLRFLAVEHALDALAVRVVDRRVVRHADRRNERKHLFERPEVEHEVLLDVAVRPAELVCRVGALAVGLAVERAVCVHVLELVVEVLDDQVDALALADQQERHFDVERVVVVAVGLLREHALRVKLLRKRRQLGRHALVAVFGQIDEYQVHVLMQKPADFGVGVLVEARVGVVC